MDAGHGIEGSSLVTAVGANGRDCAIKVSGLGDEWFVAPAEIPEGVFLDGFGPDDAGPSCGDSLLVECAGLGATLLAAAGFWPVVGADEARARRIFDETVAIFARRSTSTTAFLRSTTAARPPESTCSACSRPASGRRSTSSWSTASRAAG